MEYLIKIGESAKKAAMTTAIMTRTVKDNILMQAAEALVGNSEIILSENRKDVENAMNTGVKSSFIDRLTLDEKRISSMADGLRDVTALNDPVGEILYMKTMDNGLIIGQKRVPLGVIAIIYEARPNVTSDAFGLCLKAGNSVILRGGKEAILSNTAVVNIIRQSIKQNGYDENIIQLITDTSRETATELMKLNKYIDVLIPRGSAGLIKSVVENSSIPVIETGVGNCHIYVDKTADFEMAVKIIINAKTQRPGVCNACEKILIHEDISTGFLPKVCAALREYNVEIRGDVKAVSIVNDIIPAQESDWSEEYLDLIIGIAIVKDIDGAIAHIQKYSSGHSESIITESYTNSQKFLNEVDSSAVYINASTRFTDGGEFGLGAEIGISTQKLHARGPMGLKELTSSKFIIYGSGQIR